MARFPFFLSEGPSKKRPTALASGPSRCSFHNKGTSEIHLTGYFEPVWGPNKMVPVSIVSRNLTSCSPEGLVNGGRTLKETQDGFVDELKALNTVVCLASCCQGRHFSLILIWRCLKQLRMACPMIWKMKNLKRKRKRRPADWWFSKSWWLPQIIINHPVVMDDHDLVVKQPWVLGDLPFQETSSCFLFLYLSLFESSRVICAALLAQIFSLAWEFLMFHVERNPIRIP